MPHKIYPVNEDIDSEYTLYFDGGSRGNPGPGGAGYALFKDGIEISSDSMPLGICTNNFAEYTALILGLQKAVEYHQIQTLIIRGDSLLVIKHCQGQWKIKSPNLKPLYDIATNLLKRVNTAKLEHIKREFNKRADQLANEGIDKNSD